MELLTVLEAAKYLTLTRDRVYALVKAGKIASYAISPRNIRVTKRDLDAYLESCRKEVAGEKVRPARPQYRYPVGRLQFVNLDECGCPEN